MGYLHEQTAAVKINRGRTADKQGNIWKEVVNVFAVVNSTIVISIDLSYFIFFSRIHEDTDVLEYSSK